MNKQGQNADTNKNTKKDLNWKGMVKKSVRKTKNNCNTRNAGNCFNSCRFDYLLRYKCPELRRDFCKWSKAGALLNAHGIY